MPGDSLWHSETPDSLGQFHTIFHSSMKSPYGKQAVLPNCIARSQAVSYFSEIFGKYAHYLLWVEH